MKNIELKAPPIPMVKDVSIDLSSILVYQKEKTLMFLYNNSPIGVLRIRDFSDKNPLLKIVGISNVAVDQGHRSSGVGKKLMEVADLYIKSLKYDVSILYSSLYATRYSFYEKLGYKELEDKFFFDNKDYKVHVKYYNKIEENKEELKKTINKIGKF